MQPISSASPRFVSWLASEPLTSCRCVIAFVWQLSSHRAAFEEPQLLCAPISHQYQPQKRAVYGQAFRGEQDRGRFLRSNEQFRLLQASVSAARAVRHICHSHTTDSSSANEQARFLTTPNDPTKYQTATAKQAGPAWPPKPVHWIEQAAPSINDLVDRDLDRHVERTRYRPLAAGTLSIRQAVIFTGVQLALGGLVWLQLNTLSKALSLSSLLLVAAYPFTKRLTSWPQAFLGITINWGALVGWAAVRGALDLSVTGPLYLSGLCWTLLYDTVYAHMDKKDDVKAGIKSTALLFGGSSRTFLFGLGLGMGGLQALSGLALGAGPVYYLGVAGSTGHVMWQAYATDLDSPPNCLASFKSNANMGALLMAGIVGDRLLADPGGML